MPQRFLRPGIRTSPRWNQISHRAARLYIAILTLVDDFGRYDGRASVLWADAFAVWNEQNPQLAVNPQETAADCQQLAAADLVQFYEVGGRKFLQVTQWQERARGKSRWPDPCAQIPAESCGILRNPASLDHRHRSSPLAIDHRSSGSDDFEFLSGEIASIYNHKAGQRLSCIQEQTLTTICSRPGVRGEWDEIKAYRGRMKDRKYFPQSFTSLLEKWTDVLDRARSDLHDGPESTSRRENIDVPSL